MRYRARFLFHRSQSITVLRETAHLPVHRSLSVSMHMTHEQLEQVDLKHKCLDGTNPISIVSHELLVLENIFVFRLVIALHRPLMCVFLFAFLTLFLRFQLIAFRIPLTCRTTMVLHQSVRNDGTYATTC